jgi:transcriptional regulator with XRE-family HTH domain
VLSKLIAIQQREGWKDREIAERLGIARSTWVDVRNGNLPLSERVQMKAARAFPELLADLLGTVSNPPTERVA